MGEWKPISSAPKDGTIILGWDPIGEACVPILWDPHPPPGGWVVSWDYSHNPDCTHWTELPPPPKD